MKTNTARPVGFTPGPWEKKETSREGRYRIQTVDGFPVVCEGYPAHLADARLIEAAPDMLEALKKIKYILSQLPGFGDSIGKKISKAQLLGCVKNAGETIAKAEGK